MSDDILLVAGCPYCDIFRDSSKKMLTKLYYPVKSSINKNTEFVILDCQYCNKPIVIFRDHVSSISKEQWGRILYRCRYLFGNGMKLRLKRRVVTDHWYAHIDGINTTKLRSTRDLRRY